jgi:hypothetical protein
MHSEPDRVVTAAEMADRDRVVPVRRGAVPQVEALLEGRPWREVPAGGRELFGNDVVPRPLVELQELVGERITDERGRGVIE